MSDSTGAEGLEGIRSRLMTSISGMHETGLPPQMRELLCDMRDFPDVIAQQRQEIEALRRERDMYRGLYLDLAKEAVTRAALQGEQEDG